MSGEEEKKDQQPTPEEVKEVPTAEAPKLPGRDKEPSRDLWPPRGQLC
jgi:hypothetical protein